MHYNPNNITKMPNPNEGESESDFVSRCVPIIMKEGTAKDNEQAAAICHSKFKQSKKLAGCYDSPEDCIKGQIDMGKTADEAAEIALYFSGKMKLSEKNLIMLVPFMNVKLLPDNQLLFYNEIFPLWINKTPKGFTKEEIELMFKNVQEELKRRFYNVFP